MMVAALAMAAIAVEIDDPRWRIALGWGALIALSVQIGQWIS